VFLPIALLDRGSGRAPSAAVAPCLSDASVWHRFAALGRRVEAAAGAGAAALAAIRRTLDPIEAEAWAAADGLWAAGAGDDDWRAAVQGWDRAVRTALDDLDR
jgi:hypothetical protein